MIEEKYNRKKNTAIYWFNKSSDLRAAAGTIWASFDKDLSEKIIGKLQLSKGFSLGIACGAVFYMLCGMSLELVFKSILVAKKIEFPSSHDLVRLAKLGNLTYSDETFKLLNILSKSVVWSGKYPIPKSIEEMKSHDNAMMDYFFEENNVSDSLKLLKRKNSFDWEKFNNIWESARSVFFSIIPNEII